VDESATGSLNYFLAVAAPATQAPTESARADSFHAKIPEAARARPGLAIPVEALSSRIAAMHLRMPSIDQGVQAGAWAVFFFFLLWIGMLAVGVSHATAFIMSLVSAGAIFLFVRLRGEDRPGERV
jgi:hypothetical protein